MPTYKIFVSVFPFGSTSNIPIELLKNINAEIIYNPFQRKLTPKEVGTLAYDCDIIIAGTENLNLLIQQNSKLKMISRVGIGLDSVPLQICKDKGIQVAFTPDAVTSAVVEQTVGAMINISRFMIQSDVDIRQNKWVRYIGKSIQESTIGIIGFGRVGLGIVHILSAFTPREIFVNDISDKTKEIDNLQKIYPKLNIKQVSKEEIYKNADIISIHTPLTKNTINMITKKEFSLFKDTSFIINYARGGIINENDLYDVLKTKKIAGAAIDVFTEEPYTGNLIELNNILLTAHIGSCSIKARGQMELEAAKNVLLFTEGKNVLNNALDEHYLF